MRVFGHGTLSPYYDTEFSTMRVHKLLDWVPRVWKQHRRAYASARVGA